MSHHAVHLSVVSALQAGSHQASQHSPLQLHSSNHQQSRSMQPAQTANPAQQQLVRTRPNMRLTQHVQDQSQQERLDKMAGSLLVLLLLAVMIAAAAVTAAVGRRTTMMECHRPSSHFSDTTLRRVMLAVASQQQPAGSLCSPVDSRHTRQWLQGRPLFDRLTGCCTTPVTGQHLPGLPQQLSAINTDISAAGAQKRPL